MFDKLARATRNSSDGELRATLVEHLDELRVRLIRLVVILVIGWIVGWFIQDRIYVQLSEWARSQIPKTADYREVFRNVTEPFMLKLKFSFYIGLIMTFPLLVGQVWGFVKPGLKPQERAPLTKAIPLSAVLFFLGAGLCWLIIPLALQWFASYLTDFPGAGIYQEPGTLVFFIAKMMLAFGLGFQLPVIVFFLAKVGILTPDTLRTYWRQATVGIFITAMILTPSSDIPSMLTMAIPMTLLFFMSMGAVSWSNRKQGNRDAALNSLDDPWEPDIEFESASDDQTSRA